MLSVLFKVSSNVNHWQFHTSIIESSAASFNRLVSSLAAQLTRYNSCIFWIVFNFGLGSYPSGDMGFCPAAVFNIDDCPVIATASSQLSTIAVVAVDTGDTIANLTPREKVGMAMDVKPTDNGCLVVGYEDGSVAMWDVRKPDGPSVRAKLHNDAVASLDYCRSTQRGMSGSVDGSLVLWDGNSNVVKQVASANIEQGVACVRSRQDGKLFAVGCCNSFLNVYSGRRKMTSLASVCAHKQTVQSLTFNSFDNRLAAGSRDKTVSIWSLYRDS